MTSMWTAVNICLLPPADVAGALCTLSEHVCRPDAVDEVQLHYMLGMEPSADPVRGLVALPHMTLAQTFVRNDDLELFLQQVTARLQAQFDELCNANSLLQLEAMLHDGPVFAQINSNALPLRLPAVTITRSEPLLTLHMLAVTLCKQFQAHEAPKSDAESLARAFVDFSPGNAASVRWVSNFSVASAGERYLPHFTLGTAVAPATDFQYTHRAHVPFQECTLAVARMGNFCSCCDVLVTVKSEK
jgi:hypothetical protein